MSTISASLLATDLGSPHGATADDHWVHHLWNVTYIIGTPLAAIVLGLIIWCLVRYRARPGDTRRPPQFQYHIPLEVTYTLVPLALVAIVFAFMYVPENKITDLPKSPALTVTAEGFQWGYRFVYPNGHQETGSYSSVTNIDDETDLPTLYLPEGKTVEIKIVSDDVVHGFYIPGFLYQRDMIPGVNNVMKINVTRTGRFIGECDNLCGVYHAYMRFAVDVMPQAQYTAWYASQQPGSIHNWTPNATPSNEQAAGK
ncbi:MAG TPA: cytochrome c oxidase subunit II [Acidimicrobiales bacterium]|nr:cytochrome c oxidase subunit II [Acidimicrobiales bacterium]